MVLDRPETPLNTNGSETDIRCFGSGGAVTANLSSTGSIVTTGIGAHGIVAQSVGGGGGIGLLEPTPGVTPQIQTAGPQSLSASATGAGGAVTVNVHGPITVSGDGAFAILAQSVSNGGGLASLGSSIVFAGSTNYNQVPTATGSVTIDTQGALQASGANGVGIFAQSATDGRNSAAGTISIHIQGGLSGHSVTGGSGAQGAAIWVLDGNTQNSILIDSGSSISAASGRAITYSGGYQVDVTNNGTITGSVSAGVLMTGNVVNNGFWNLGGASVADVVNNGRIVLGSSAPYGQSSLAGDFTQSPSGTTEVHVDFANRRADLLSVQGNAVLAGRIVPVITTVLADIAIPVMTVSGSSTGTLTSSSSLFGYGMTQSGTELLLSATSANFAPAGFNLAQSQLEIASHLQDIWNHGASPALGALFALLGNTADVSPAAYSAQLRQLSPDAAFAPGARGLAAATSFANNTLSCPQFEGTTAMLVEGRCAWMRVTGRATSQDSGNGITSYNLNRVTWQIGGQTEFAPGWFIGGSLAYEDSRLSIRKMVAVH